MLNRSGPASPWTRSRLAGWLRYPAARLAAWRRRRRVSPAWGAFAAALAVLMLLPVGTVALLAISAQDNIWPHLMRTVLPASLRDTLLLLAGVGAVVVSVGTGAAWLTTMYRFPGRALLDRMLVLPLAVPTYIAAYCYVELLDYAGPVQKALRAVTGWQSARDYWFPEVRSLWGAGLVLSAVLYPYVYLAARATFVQQSVCMLEVARTLGRTAAGTFWAIALPLARPALAAGVALVLMECLNDLGAVQYLGVQTLSASIYTTWQQRGSLGGAAQISMIALAFVLMLILIERSARGRAHFHHTTGRFRSIPFAELPGARGYLAAALCALPVLLGFVLPMLVLLAQGLTHLDVALQGDFWRAARNSLLVAAVAAVVTVVLGLVLAYARRLAPNALVRSVVRVVGLGYALPGTVLALGLLISLAAFDNWLDASLRAILGLSTGLLLSGSVLVLILAYSIRFLAVSLSTFEAGFERLSPNLDAAARTLGETGLSALWRVHLPLLLPALGSAGLIVFVDGMKELAATLLLRPFNFETLATHVYSFAAIEQFERSALGALTIVLIGLLPVLLLHEAVAGGRSGAHRAMPSWLLSGVERLRGLRKPLASVLRVPRR
ncbi:MAG: iron ABC transporter permease [Hyphomicrobiaceae bacterium]|nr:iron ABC transporter permease [Hyphomicrobiaceae bacterium]